MLAIDDLKEHIEVTATTVECPVRGCTVRVQRQRRTFRKEPNFRCVAHRIYISTSTFEYEDAHDNLLWKDEQDLNLLDEIMKAKRESRMARDNSEDAVAWNVFRFLENNSLAEGFLTKLTGIAQEERTEVIYWSYSQKEGGSWSLLNTARTEFGEEIKRGSEPDVIIRTDKALFFIETKLTSGNETSDRNESSKKYETGGNGWFKEVFTTGYRTVAIAEKKYELMRLWLLATWMVEREGLAFYLVNLVLEGREENIEALFRKHIKKNLKRRFIRLMWESICQYVVSLYQVEDKDIMISFFKNKTLGYRNGILHRAFSISWR